MDTVREFLAHQDGMNPLLLTGVPGSGKSTLVARTLSALEDNTEGVGPCVAHFVDALGFSRDARFIAERLCRELRDLFGGRAILPEMPPSPAGLPTALGCMIAHAAARGGVNLLIDGLDKMEVGAGGNMNLEWLPRSLPHNVRLVLSGNGCVWAEAVRRRFGKAVLEVDLPLLEGAARAELAHALLTEQIPSASMEAAEILANKKCGGRPGYLSAAVAEVAASAVSESGQNVIAAVEAVEEGEIEVYDQALARLEELHGDGVVADTLCAYSAVVRGMSDEEMLAFLRTRGGTEALTEGHWQEIREGLLPLLSFPGHEATRQSGLSTKKKMAVTADAALERAALGGALAVRNARVARAVEERYLQESSFTQRDVHAALVYFYRDRPSSPHVVHAVTHHLLACADWAGLRECLARSTCTIFMCRRARRYALLNCWAAVVAQDPGGRAALVRDVEESLNSDPHATLAEREYACAALARFLEFAGRPDEAASLWRRFTSHCSENGDHAFTKLAGLGMALLAAGTDLDEAELCFRDALGGSPPSVDDIFYDGARSGRPAMRAVVRCLGDILDRQGRFDAAAELYEDLISELRHELRGSSDAVSELILVRALGALSSVRQRQGRYEDAESALEDGLRLLEAAVGAEHPETAAQLVAMAQCYKAHGEWQKGEFCLVRALAFYRDTFGEASMPVAHMSTLLAELQRVQGNMPAADKLYSRALCVVECCLGSEHIELTTYINNVAEVARVQGNLGRAELLYKRALYIDEATYGHNSATLPIRLSNLGELYRDMGRLDEAEPLYARALSLDEVALGKDHPNIATYLNNLAGCRKAAGKLQNALDLYGRALAIDTDALGQDHPDVAICHNNMAGLYRALGESLKALSLYERALAINSAALGEGHTDVGIFYNNSALCLRDLARLDEAELHFIRAISIGEGSLGARHPQVASRLINMGSMVLQSSKTSLAEVLFERALAIYEHAGKATEAAQCRKWLRSVDDTIALGCADLVEDMLDTLEEEAAETHTVEMEAAALCVQTNYYRQRATTPPRVAVMCNTCDTERQQEATAVNIRSAAIDSMQDVPAGRTMGDAGTTFSRCLGWLPEVEAGQSPAGQHQTFSKSLKRPSSTTVSEKLPDEGFVSAAPAVHSPQLDTISMQLGVFIQQQGKLLEAHQQQAERALLLEQRRQRLFERAQQQALLTRSQQKQAASDSRALDDAVEGVAPTPFMTIAAIKETPEVDTSQTSSGEGKAFRAAPKALSTETDVMVRQNEVESLQQDDWRGVAADIAQEKTPTASGPQPWRPSPVDGGNLSRKYSVTSCDEGGSASVAHILPAVSVTDAMMVEYMSMRVEMVHPRCYRCNLTGKELSSFSLMKAYYQRNPKVLAEVATWAATNRRMASSQFDAMPLGVVHKEGVHALRVIDEGGNDVLPLKQGNSLPLISADPIASPFRTSIETLDFKSLLEKERALRSLARDLRMRTI